VYNKILIQDELGTSYLSYAMSVIVSRAIPDVRDGLKPVHRRVLYAMYDAKCLPNSPYRKSARVVGDVIGRYHPHGDSAVYESLVRLAQDFSVRLVMVDGQGNFGSIDGDPPAAMRYTEVRLDPLAITMLESIGEDTVDFKPNYDGLEIEPVVLPASFPAILVNGTSGIAVGMATNIPTHNLGEIIDGTILCLDNKDVSLAELMQAIPGPDLPTGGIIIGSSGIYHAYSTGRGTIAIRAKSHIETLNDRDSIIIDEFPYQVNKAKFIESVCELSKDKKIEGISSIRDESDKSGIRVVIDLKRSIDSQVILGQLYDMTTLQISFSINSVLLNGLQAETMSLKRILLSFIDFKKLVVLRRTRCRLRKAQERVHILFALYIAILNIDIIIKIIRASIDLKAALTSLLQEEWIMDEDILLLHEEAYKLNSSNKIYKFTEIQVKAILDLKLHRLTSLEKDKLSVDLKELIAQIIELTEILNSECILNALIKKELLDIKERFADPRRTEISHDEINSKNIEDFIVLEEMVVTVSINGYIKRTTLDNYKTQKRGGKGKSTQNKQNEDEIVNMFIADTHDIVLFFSNLGRVYRMHVHKLPLVNSQGRGRALVNLFPLSDNESINNMVVLPKEKEDLNIFFATKFGNIRRNLLSDFDYIPVTGKIAIGLGESDVLVSVYTCEPSAHIMLSTANGKSIRFIAEDIRLSKGRSGMGVRGIRLSRDDEVISMTILSSDSSLETHIRDQYLKISTIKRLKLKLGSDIKIDNDIDLNIDELKKYASEEQFLLTVTENGFGKRSSSYEYRVTNRGGSGIVNINTSLRNGKVIVSFPANNDDELILMTDKGQAIRIPVSDIRITGRNTLGVRLVKLNDTEKVASVQRIADDICINDGDDEENNIDD